MATESGLITDIYKQGDQLEALLLDTDPTSSVMVAAGASSFV